MLQTGFEFKKRRAFPVITGIVVAAENEETMLEVRHIHEPVKQDLALLTSVPVTVQAYWEAEHDAEEKRRAKREDQAIKRWKRLIHGLRIRQRLQEQYADAEQRGSSPIGAADEVGSKVSVECAVFLIARVQEVQQEGGFLTGADDVVQPYTLPRNFHELLSTSTALSLDPAARESSADHAKDGQASRRDTLPAALDDVMSEDSDDRMEELTIPAQQMGGAEERQQLKPKTMLELAEAAAEKQDLSGGQLPASSSLSSDRTIGQSNGAGARVPPTDGEDTVRRASRSRTSRKADASRSRKRRKASADSSEPEVEGENGPSTQASPAKRARKAAPPLPAPTRVLRTRTAKSAAKIQEEREMEEAYRKAVTE